MQISDIQDRGGVLPRTRELLTAALDREKPDFVVFTGDQIKGYSFSLLLGGKEKQDASIGKTITVLAQLMEERGIPFTVTFGNHDHDAPMAPDEQLRRYLRSPLCLAEESPEGVSGYANHVIPVAGSQGGGDALLFYFLDSHNRTGGLGYDPLDPAQVAWYRETREAKAVRGRYVPSMLFMHVPVDEINELYREVPRGTPGAFPGYLNYKGKYFVLDEDKVNAGAFMGEMPSSPPINAGLFEAACEKGDMTGMFFGHDHTNGFHGAVRGIPLGYTPSAGYNAYGPGRKRGVRVFRFTEDDPRDYETRVVTDEEILELGDGLALYTRFADMTPTSIAAAIPLIVRAGLWIAAFVVSLNAGMLAVKLGGLMGWQGLGIAVGGFAALIGAIELIWRLKK